MPPCALRICSPYRPNFSPQVNFGHSLLFPDKYFMTNLTLAQTQFLESVLTLKPKVATFDCDGTLWSGDAGEGFFKWELKESWLPEQISRWIQSRYAEYRAGKVAEEVMCGEMV